MKQQSDGQVDRGYDSAGSVSTPPINQEFNLTVDPPNLKKYQNQNTPVVSQSFTQVPT